jgi:glutamine cyclotransferase
VKLPRLAVGVAALATGACDGCGQIPEPSAVPSAALETAAPRAPTVVATVVGQQPHDPSAYTQGLVFAFGSFLESTGLYGASSLRRVEPASGRVLQSVALDPQVFGEGLARLHGEVFQLTWKEHRCFVYEEATFQKRREMTYPGEGWGLTTNGDLLVMSDGSAALWFLEPTAMRLVRKITVHDGSSPLEKLNELEWVHGEILANVWGRNVIARIDPRSGAVRGFIDLSGLPEPHHDDVNSVLNGIAYDEAGDRLFVTGKQWSSMFEIRLPAEAQPPGHPAPDGR